MVNPKDFKYQKVSFKSPSLNQFIKVNNANKICQIVWNFVCAGKIVPLWDIFVV